MEHCVSIACVSDVDSLREQLRERGYLTHRIERWFALDPWSSRAFWLELLTVALKAGALISGFAALPMTAIMLLRNPSAGATETVALFLTYAATWVIVAGSLIVVIALAMKLRPALAIDTPRALLAISMAAAATLVAPVAIWWYGFDVAPRLPELLAGTGLAMVFFLVATIVISAALLSFSIYEVHRIPAIHQKSRALPIGLAGLALVALLFVPALTRAAEDAREAMVATSPSTRRVALVAVDGLTHEILLSRGDVRQQLMNITRVTGGEGSSTAERWASIGTGVATARHGVRSLEGVRFRGGSDVLQRVSRADVALMHLAPRLGVARREPLPPTVRRRDYVWEIFARRGLPSASVNWWATADTSDAGLTTIAPDSIFAASRGEPLQVDALATRRLVDLIESADVRFVAVYLPALDVILNRAELDAAASVAQSMRALDGVAVVVRTLRERGFEVVVAGVPGDTQSGSAVVASTIPIPRLDSTWDLAPTILAMLGFPASREMPGSSGLAEPQQRIESYGSRRSTEAPAELNQEYYENLRSLGYIQ